MVEVLEQYIVCQAPICSVHKFPVVPWFFFFSKGFSDGGIVGFFTTTYNTFSIKNNRTCLRKGSWGDRLIMFLISSVKHSWWTFAIHWKCTVLSSEGCIVPRLLIGWLLQLSTKRWTYAVTAKSRSREQLLSSVMISFRVHPFSSPPFCSLPFCLWYSSSRNSSSPGISPWGHFVARHLSRRHSSSDDEDDQRIKTCRQRRRWRQRNLKTSRLKYLLLFKFIIFLIA